MNITHEAGHWFVQKWRARLAEAGDVQTVARQLRKQGTPLEIALQILTQPMPRPAGQCPPCNRKCREGRDCPARPVSQPTP